MLSACISTPSIADGAPAVNHCLRSLTLILGIKGLLLVNETAIRTLGSEDRERMDFEFVQGQDFRLIPK